MYSQPRRPQGTSGGGQFTHSRRPEVDVELQRVGTARSDVDYNADGTFEFPPVARSYAQLVSFWLSCRVPESAIRQMQIGYVELMEGWHTSAGAAWVDENPPPAEYTKGRLGRPNEPNPAYEEWKEAYFAELDRLEAIHPADIDPAIARDLARVARMRWQAKRSEGWLPGITGQVDATAIEIPGVGDVTVADLLERYPVQELDESVWRDRTAEHLEFIAARLDEMASRGT